MNRRLRPVAPAMLSFRLAVLCCLAVAQSAPSAEEVITAPKVKPFSDVTKKSGVAEALAHHYQQHSNWWMSGLNLVDLDADGNLDLFFAAHGAGVSLALLNDGHGSFTPAPGIYPPTEIHLPYDINED